jgi:hypothetical protein
VDEVLEVVDVDFVVLVVVVPGMPLLEDDDEVEEVAVEVWDVSSLELVIPVELAEDAVEEDGDLVPLVCADFKVDEITELASMLPLLVLHLHSKLLWHNPITTEFILTPE